MPSGSYLGQIFSGFYKRHPFTASVGAKIPAPAQMTPPHCYRRGKNKPNEANDIPYVPYFRTNSSTGRGLE